MQKKKKLTNDLQRVSTNCKQIFDAFMDTCARKAFFGIAFCAF